MRRRFGSRLISRGIQDTAFRPVQNQRGQHSGPVSAGVDADPVGTLVDDLTDGMAMNNHLAMIAFIFEKWGPDPAKVRLALQRQVDPWPNAGMNEQIVTEAQGIGKAGDKSAMS